MDKWQNTNLRETLRHFLVPPIEKNTAARRSDFELGKFANKRVQFGRLVRNAIINMRTAAAASSIY